MFNLSLVRGIALVAAFALTAGCGGTGSSARVHGLMGGPDMEALVRNETDAVTVEAFRIDGGFGARGAEGPRIAEYPILAGPVPVDARSRKELIGILTDDDTYLWDIAKACEFMPGVVVRYRTEDTQLDVLLCFSCDELRFDRNGMRAGREDFDPRRADLVAIAQRLFPDDAALAGL